MNFHVYIGATGAVPIIRSGTISSADLAGQQLFAGEIAADSGPVPVFKETHYVLNGVLTARPVHGAAWDTLAIAADGVAAATLRGDAAVASTAVTAAGTGFTSVPSIVYSGGTPTLTAIALAILTATSLASIALGAAGSGFTDVPAVSITGGGGSGATGTAALTPTSVASSVITVPGSGYTFATVAFSGGGGTGAAATATVSPLGFVESIVHTALGTGYTSRPAMTISGDGTGAAATSVLTATSVASLALVLPGTGFTGTPDIAIIGDGTGATGSALFTPTTLASISMLSGGAGYSATPSVAVTGGGGTGATATATRTTLINPTTVSLQPPAGLGLAPIADQVVTTGTFALNTTIPGSYLATVKAFPKVDFPATVIAT